MKLVVVGDVEEDWKDLERLLGLVFFFLSILSILFLGGMLF